MTVGNQTFSGKGAREEAARALSRAVLSRRDDYAPQPRASFRGFEILSRDKTGGEPVAGPVHPGRGNLYRAYQSRESSRHHAEHRAHAPRPRQIRCRRNGARSNGLKKRCPTIRPRPTGRSSTKRASRNCSPVRRNSTPPLTSTRASGKRPNPQTASLRSRPNSPPPP